MAHLQMSMHGNTSISITYDYRWTNVWNFTNHDQQECQSLIGKDAKWQNAEMVLFKLLSLQALAILQPMQHSRHSVLLH